MLGIAVVALMGTGLRLESAAQPTARLSALIEQLELGEPAISDVHWAFIDMEHGPYLLDQLQDRLAEFKPDGSPRPEPTPIVRIPIEGSQDPQFAVKQVLDSGAFGIVFPRVETADQARRAIASMRYPPQRGATNPEPHGPPRVRSVSRRTILGSPVSRVHPTSRRLAAQPRRGALRHDHDRERTSG